MATVTKRITRKTPELQPGDFLTLEEFEQRYEAMPEIKAELIEGVVCMASPVTWIHSSPHGDLITWAGTYKTYTPGVDQGAEPTFRINKKNEYQPDLMLIVLPDHGGNARFTKKNYVEGIPELVAEIAYSSVSKDLNSKLQVYQRRGVNEYIVWRVEDECIDWFRNIDGKFQPMTPDADGVIMSVVFPGLWLDSKAMANGDMQAVLKLLNLGLQSPAHAAFVKQLTEQRKSP